jgi:hypothetical protein
MGAKDMGLSVVLLGTKWGIYGNLGSILGNHFYLMGTRGNMMRMTIYVYTILFYFCL